MQFQVTLEVLFQLTVEAPSSQEAQDIAASTPYKKWLQKYVVREDCVPLEESPINPRAK